jgi:cystathionine beta-lyase
MCPSHSEPYATLTADGLRDRRSVKWRHYPPDVLPVFVAELDAVLAEPVADALVAAVERSDTGYAHPGRLPEAFAGFAHRHWDWWPDPTQTLVVPDVMRGIAETLRLVTEPGAGVVVNTPAYPPFFSTIADVGRSVVTSPLARTAAGEWELDLDRLAADFAGGASVYLLCNPHNPTGLVLDRATLTAVAELGRRHGVRVIVDEVHAPLVYPPAEHVPYATAAGEDADDAIVYVSASKAFNLPGLKCALVIAGPRSMPVLSRMPLEARYGTSLFGVIANEAAYTAGDPWLTRLLADLDRNRRRLAELVAEHLPGVGSRVPDATFLAWLDCRDLGLGDDPAATFLDHGRVALNAGPAFGEEGKGWARLNFGCHGDVLSEAVRRMAAALSR